MSSKLPNRKDTLENVSQEANCEKNNHHAKMYRSGNHLGAILASSWGTWEAFRGHFGRLGTNLGQHKAILSHLGANLNNEASWSQHIPT